MKETLFLSENWILKESVTTSENAVLPSGGIPASIPGTIHTDLLAAGYIEDPFYGDNERSVKWVAERDWKYELQFDLPERLRKRDYLKLVFSGLDTACRVILNGRELGSVQNMFRSYSFDIKNHVNMKNNLLEVEVESPLHYALNKMRPLKQFPSARHPERAFVRKAQYSFGWDWGPELPTSGIWRPVFLEAYDQLKIDSVYFETESIENDKALVKARAQLSSHRSEGLNIIFKLSASDRAITETVPCNGAEFVETSLEIQNPKLWWPIGYGNPDMYRLKIELKDKQRTLLDYRELDVGIRTVSLELKDKHKNTFQFRINNKAVFLKGANWIPADSFLPRITPAKYESQLRLAAEANMNVLRVWGGGIYEDNYFYDLCDQLGILVWQDFMFACSAYPEDDEFIAEVRPEIEENVRRLQPHPSVFLWCGNNENEWIHYRDGCGAVKEMAGYTLFHTYLPEWLEELDPSRPYWPSSPFGDDEDPNDPRSGNRHQWNVWSYWMDYTEVVQDRSLFVTEFGFQAPANFHTFKRNLPAAALHPQHEVFEFHNKQEEGPERLFRFLSGHLPVRLELPDFIYLTQLNQAFALKTCLEHWRLNWPETSGSIIWQLNDCWPVTSWSLIDSDGFPKLAYYAVKRTFGDPLIAFRLRPGLLELIIENRSIDSGYLELVKVDKDFRVEQVHREHLKSTHDKERRWIVQINRVDSDPEAIYIASVYDDNARVVARNAVSECRWKHLHFATPDARFKLETHPEGIVMHSDIPLFFVQLTHPTLRFNDNGFILLPEEPKIIEVDPGNLTYKILKEITVFSLNTYLG